jgi:phage-related protein
VYPYEFLNSGETGQSAGTINNPGSVCSPIYKIVGNGSGTLSVNGKAMTYTVSGTLYIDVRRMIAYDLNRVNKNNELNGNYRDLRLVSGENSVSASTGTLTVYPYWGYVL